MSLIPLEIASKEFRRTMRGYDPVEVKNFLEEISREMGRILSEKAAIAAELDAVRDNLAKYHELEDAIKETLLLAQQTKNDVTDAIAISICGLWHARAQVRAKQMGL